LYVWINGLNAGETTQLRIAATRAITRLPMLDIVTGGVVACEQEFVLTGTDEQAQPVVLGVTDAGVEIWRTVVTGAKPTIFPRPFWIGQTVITWQTAPDKLHIAQVSAQGLSHLRTLAVGMPPIKIAAHGHMLYIMWAESGGIRGYQVSASAVNPLQIAMPYPDNLALGAVADKIYVAWKQRGATFIAALASDAQTLHNPTEIILTDMAGGKMELVAGGSQPLLWVQRLKLDEEDAHYTSALVMPDSQPQYLDGPVHRVAWWDARLVVLGNYEMLFFKPV
jgi:hypothetical protein